MGHIPIESLYFYILADRTGHLKKFQMKPVFLYQKHRIAEKKIESYGGKFVFTLMWLRLFKEIF